MYVKMLDISSSSIAHQTLLIISIPRLHVRSNNGASLDLASSVDGSLEGWTGSVGTVPGLGSAAASRKKAWIIGGSLTTLDA